MIPGPFVRKVRTGAAAVLILTLMAWPVAANKGDLARARSLYNDRQFDQAIEAARVAREAPETQDAAAVVLARAHLERYRERVDPADLGSARQALGVVRSSMLDAREKVEYLMALGQALFLEDEFGAAAAMFESGIDQARAVDPALGEAVLDWWGSAVERQADGEERDVRLATFDALGVRMSQELKRNPGSAAASYWTAVAWRGSGDVMAAWYAAVAGWVRARLANDRSAALRADLDKLVVQGIIPDRVKTLPSGERAAAELQLRAEWELVKERWK